MRIHIHIHLDIQIHLHRDYLKCGSIEHENKITFKERSGCKHQ
jgi:hypothetical protein